MSKHHYQSSKDQEDIQKILGIRRAVNPHLDDQDQSLSTAKKTKKMLDAIYSRNEVEALKWLSLGAEPNEPISSSNCYHPLDLALSVGMGPAFIIPLLKAGGRLHFRSSDHPLALAYIASAISNGSIELMEAFANHYSLKEVPINNINGSDSKASSWDEQWRNSAIKAERLEVAHYFMKKTGKALTEEEWPAFVEKTILPAISAVESANPINAQHQRCLNQQVLVPFLKSELDQVPAEQLKLIYASATRSAHMEVLKTLLESGLKPSETWLGAVYISYPPQDDPIIEVPLVSFAWLSSIENPSRIEAYKLLSHIESAVEDSKETPLSPWLLYRLTVTQLAEFQRKFSMAGVDAEGNNVFHLWSVMKYKYDPVRSGWKTMIKAAPDLMRVKNKQGFTPLDLLFQGMSPQERVPYEKTMAMYEKSVLKEESLLQTEGKIKTSKDKASVRSRL